MPATIKRLDLVEAIEVALDNADDPTTATRAEALREFARTTPTVARGSFTMGPDCEFKCPLYVVFADLVDEVGEPYADWGFIEYFDRHTREHSLPSAERFMEAARSLTVVED
jgi:hypothetical protein